ncbi:MAG: methanogenesis marker 16 metalloprotein [Methanococcoides sp.]|nr:methanogenesis marker 16 metalloprotein [Methanococcoides sp.]MCD4821189.1 methanogenesis marker 16 metalloprotein [Methanococcoides sp.]
MEQSIEQINRKIEKGDAVVLTAQQVCDLVDSGEDIRAEDVDVVTAATRAIMSGTYAILSFPVESSHSFLRAKEVYMNGVPAHVGPCPNERLGILDLMLFGTDHSVDDSRYGAGHLFRDLAEGLSVEVKVVTDKGESFKTKVTLDDMPYAMLYGTRHAFKNYSAFVNTSDEPAASIFHAMEFGPRLTEATISGCGQINPVKNDPLLESIGIGTRMLMNGSEGFIMGSGTRSSAEKPNLTAFADMHGMKPEYMGGFFTSAGPECIVSWAVPVPVTSDSVLESIKERDRQLKMPVMAVDKRACVGYSDYGDVWEGTDLMIDFSPNECIGCTLCEPAEMCPMASISFEDGEVKLDRYTCFNCGLCSTLCVTDVYTANLGSINFELGGESTNVPIVLRQSDKKRALELSEKLKEQILDGSFRMTSMVERIRT